ncbi:hypothetical protein I7I52_05261 [Histoplasma capsulatum]|uniref:Uncharacterized protein n=1 Tax=Ajellomyces capsulatus TaxID=5037 RepID=A0A8H7YPM1_AJECA|nr:hypothetical protein I7I52_05261 [Histoplasma capsulatum]
MLGVRWCFVTARGRRENGSKLQKACKVDSSILQFFNASFVFFRRVLGIRFSILSFFLSFFFFFCNCFPLDYIRNLKKK